MKNKDKKKETIIIVCIAVISALILSFGIYTCFFTDNGFIVLKVHQITLIALLQKNSLNLVFIKDMLL